MQNHSSTNALRRAAKYYAAHGWKIFPVVPEGKAPLTPNGYQDASDDAQTVADWWAKWPNANIGFACAPSGFVALDGDPAHYAPEHASFLDDLLNEFPTTAQTTPTLGAHLLYRLPDDVTLSNSRGGLPPGIDVRANGYVLLAPSVVRYEGDEARNKGVQDGYTNKYEWCAGLNPVDIEPQILPPKVVKLLSRKREQAARRPDAPSTSVNGHNGYARAALLKEIDRLASAQVGERNEQLNRSAFNLGQLVAGGELSESEVVDQLEATAIGIGLDEREIERTIRSGLESGKKHPRGAPPLPQLHFVNGASAAESKSDEQPELEGETSKKKKASTKGIASSIYRQMKNVGYSFRFNEMRDRIELDDGTPLHDGEQALAIAKLFDLGLKNKSLMLDVFFADAWQNRYNPLLQFFDGLTWDGKDHIDLLAGWFTCKSEPIQYADGHYEKVSSVWLRRWLVGAVGKARHSIQNPMLVLAGPQGIGKSEFARWLCSPVSEYFISSPILPDNADHLRWLVGNLIWEVAELGATTRKADIEGLKAFLTRHECTYRVPYARNEVHRPARASFIGTINPDNAGFLMDVTGNRRFLSAEITGIDWEKYTRNIDPAQVWAQACAIYERDPLAWRLTPEEEVHRDAINESYGAEDPILEAIEEMFRVEPEVDPDPKNAFIATSEIVRILATHIHEPTTRQLQMGVAKALRRLNVTKGRKETGRGPRGYFGLTRSA